MADDVSKTGTTEIIVAIGTVVFIFSLIGLLNINPVGDLQTLVSGEAAEGQEAMQVVEGAGTESEAGSEPAQELDSVSVPELIPVSGTSLSPAMYHFKVAA